MNDTLNSYDDLFHQYPSDVTALLAEAGIIQEEEKSSFQNYLWGAGCE